MNTSKATDQRFWSLWRASGAIGTFTVPSGYHQIHSDFCLPTSPDLLRMVLAEEEMQRIADMIGRQDLERMAAVTHNTGANVDYEAAAKQEGRDLQILRSAIYRVLGCEKPWIMGFASDFSRGLLTCIQ